MRKGRDGEKREKKTGKKKKEKRRMKIVATTSLSAVDRPNPDRLNAARSRQFLSNLVMLPCNSVGALGTHILIIPSELQQGCV